MVDADDDAAADLTPGSSRDYGEQHDAGWAAELDGSRRGRRQQGLRRGRASAIDDSGGRRGR